MVGWRRRPGLAAAAQDPAAQDPAFFNTIPPPPLLDPASSNTIPPPPLLDPASLHDPASPSTIPPYAADPRLDRPLLHHNGVTSDGLPRDLGFLRDGCDNHLVGVGLRAGDLVHRGRRFLHVRVYARAGDEGEACPAGPLGLGGVRVATGRCCWRGAGPVCVDACTHVSLTRAHARGRASVHARDALSHAASSLTHAASSLTHAASPHPR